MRAGRLIALVIAAAGFGGAAPAAAQDCLSADPPGGGAAPVPLRFGVFPLAAGSAGAAQGEPAPEDPAKALAALQRLRPPGRELVVRLNRMFWADGDAGLTRFAGLVDAYARAGFRSELQVRYHPPEGRAGDIAGWLEYVRAAVRTFAPRRSVVELSITNEANLTGSPNTSDGFYAGVVDALVQGVIAARAEADRLGRRTSRSASPMPTATRRSPTIGSSSSCARRAEPRSRPRSTTSACRSTPGCSGRPRRATRRATWSRP